ncbi:right-handed parallel beta-helix repeat-containing protein [Hymenobacter sp. HD11105]
MITISKKTSRLVSAGLISLGLLCGTISYVPPTATYPSGGRHDAKGIFIPPKFVAEDDWIDEQYVVTGSAADPPLILEGLKFRNLREPKRPTPTDGGFTQCILNNTTREVIIRGCKFWTKNHAIRGSAAPHRITIEDSYFVGIKPAGQWVTKGRAYDKGNASFAVFKNNYVEGMGSFLVPDYQQGCVFKCLRNIFINIDGRFTQTDFPAWPVGRIQYQFFQATGDGKKTVGPGCEIAYNRIFNDPDKSYPEDLLNLFRVKGTALNRILIHDNLLDGCYVSPYAIRVIDTNFATNRQLHGITNGGMMLEFTDYCNVYNNTLVRVNEYGIASSGGRNNWIHHNTILNGNMFRTGVNAGLLYPWGNCGIFVNRFTETENGGNIVENNSIGAMYWRPDENHRGPRPKGNSADGLGPEYRETWKPPHQHVDSRNDIGMLTGMTLLRNNRFYSGDDPVTSAPKFDHTTSNTGGLRPSKAAEDYLRDAWLSKLPTLSFKVGPTK